MKILDGVDDIAIHSFTDKDVVRHKLVQKIILAYEKYENKQRAEKDMARKNKSTKTFAGDKK